MAIKLSYFLILISWDHIILTSLSLLYAATLYITRISSDNQTENDKLIHNKRIVNIIAKFLVLGTVSVWKATAMVLRFAISSWISVVAIDSIINCWSIFLIYDHNKKIFHCICGSCHKCIEYYIYGCVQCVEDTEKDDFLEVYDYEGTEIELRIDTDNKNMKDDESITAL